MSTNATAPATVTALLSVLDAMTDPSGPNGYGYEGDAWNAWVSGVESATEQVKEFAAAHPDQFQSITAEQRQAIEDVTAVALGYTQRRGEWINARAAANLLAPITDPEGAVPVMAPYLTFTVRPSAPGSAAVATFDSLDDARAFAKVKTEQGQPHTVGY
jgi:hypothetical protein